jgi:hypothetical protein
MLKGFGKGFFVIFFLVLQQLYSGLGRLIAEVSRSHIDTTLGRTPLDKGPMYITHNYCSLPVIFIVTSCSSSEYRLTPVVCVYLIMRRRNMISLYHFMFFFFFLKFAAQDSCK